MTDTKTALIVGAGSGLGAALARRFSGAGLRVAVAARRLPTLAALAEAVGPNVHPYECDATQETDVDRLFQSVEQDLGELAVVVHNVGAFSRKSILDFDGRGPREVLAECLSLRLSRRPLGRPSHDAPRKGRSAVYRRHWKPAGLGVVPELGDCQVRRPRVVAEHGARTWPQGRACGPCRDRRPDRPRWSRRLRGQRRIGLKSPAR